MNIRRLLAPSLFVVLAGCPDMTPPADTTPPTISSISPADGAMNVAVGGTITITFSEALAAAPELSLKNGTASITGSISRSADGTAATFTPASALAPKTTFTLSIDSYADAAGNVGAAQTSRFTTAALVPTVSSNVPASGATNVNRKSPLSAVFSRDMDATSFSGSTVTVSEGSNAVAVTTSYDATSRTLTITPSAPLLENKAHTVTLSTGIKDSLGTPLAAAHAWSFTTLTDVPTVTITPAHMMTEVSGNAPVRFTFSEAMLASTLDGAVTVAIGGTAVPGTKAWDATNLTYTFTPTGAYAAGSSVVANISTAATDVSGNALAAAVSSTFTVSNAPALALTDPAANETGVALDTPISLQFTVPMDATTLVAANVWIENAQGTVVAAAYAAQGVDGLTITPNAPLIESSTYTLVVSTRVKSLTQIAFTTEHRQTFTTVGVAPFVSSVSPSDGANDVALNANIRVIFAEDMTTTTFTAANLRLSDGASDVMGTVTVVDARTAQFAPAAPLREQARYTIIVGTGVADVFGNTMADEFRSSFVTEELPRVTSITPLPNSVDVPQSSALIVAFNKALAPSTVALTAVSASTASSFTLSDGSTRIEGSIAWEASSRTVRISRTNVGAPTPWTAGRRYVLTIDGSLLTDLSGNAVGGRIVTSFVAGSAGDTTPPTVVGSSPGNGDTGVSRTAALSADFSETIDASTLNSTTVQLLDGTTSLPGRIEYFPALRRVSFVPFLPLPAGRALTFSLGTGIKDMSGNAKAAANSVAFTSDQNAAPTVVRVTPANAAMNVNVNAAIRVDFSEALNPNTVDLTLADGATAIAGATSYDAATRTAVFTPAAALPPSAMLTLTVKSTVADLEGATLGADVTSAFTTIANSANDVTRPTVSSTTPANNATGVRARPQIAIGFSEAMDPASVTVDRFSLKIQGGAALPFGLQYDVSGDRAVLTPSVALVRGTTYEVSVLAGVEDLAGNTVDPAAAASTLRFTVDQTAPTIITRVPAAASTVGSASRVELTFSEDMEPSSIDAASFTLRFNGNPVLAAVSYDPGTRTAVLQPASALSDGTQTVALDGMRVRDLAGNTISDTSTFTVSSQQPAVVSATPCGTIVDVYDLGTQSITITFDRAVRKAAGGALDGTALKLRLGNTDQAVTVAHTAGSTTATLTPSAPLQDTQTYEVVANTGVADNATGVAMAQAYSCTFQTQRVVFKDLVEDTVTTNYTLTGASGNGWARVNSPDDTRNSIVWRGGNVTDGQNYVRQCAIAGAADRLIAFERTVDLTGLTEAELRYDEFHLINGAAADRGRAVVISGATTRELAGFTGTASGYTNRIGQGSLNLRDFVGTTVRVRFELLIKGVNSLNCGAAPAGNKGLFIDNLYVVGK